MVVASTTKNSQAIKCLQSPHQDFLPSLLKQIICIISYAPVSIQSNSQATEVYALQPFKL